MVYMKIHCADCGGTWEVYKRQRDTAAARICPHCDHRIDGDIWTGKILPAFQAVGAANMALAFDHTDNHSAEFSVDFIADGKFQSADKADIMNEIFYLQAAVDALQDSIGNKKKHRMNETV